MKEIGFINIVGIPYKVFLYNDFKKLNEDAKKRDARYLHDTKEDKNLDGYCDYQAKEIRIFDDEYTAEHYFEQTLTHEITHAYLYEIGNSNHDDEDYVDKISKWVPFIMTMRNQGMELITNARIEEEQRSTKTN